MGIRTRRMLKDDTPASVKIHMQAFKGFFLTFLGERFLHVLYSSIISDPSGIGYVAEENGNVLGFVVGTISSSGLYKRLIRQRFWQFGLASLRAVILKPATVLRLLRAFRMPGQNNGVANCGTLMSIAVAPGAQGMGVGRVLVNAFLTEAELRGVDFINLTTDRNSNDKVNDFYKQRGFKLLRSYKTPEGREMNEYLISLRDNRLDSRTE